MEDCIFCRIIKGIEHAFIPYMDDKVIVFLDKYPVSKAHTLIAPIRHYSNIFEADDESLCRIIKLARIVAKIIRDKFGADGIRIVQNNGSLAGQLIFHLHFHVIPYYRNSKMVRYRRTLDHWEGEEVSTILREEIRRELGENN